MTKKLLEKKAFTLIELVIVIALIGFLATMTIISINPGKSLSDTRNAQRTADILKILNAVTQYTTDNNQTLASLGPIPLCTGNPSSVNIGTSAGLLNLSTGLVDKYTDSIPKDPSNGTDANTFYTICQTANGRIKISAPNAEGDKVISSTR